MKTAKEWIEWHESNPDVPDEELNKRIQSDALQYAIALCEKQTEPRKGEDEDYSNGHANRGVSNCLNAIQEHMKSIGVTDGSIATESNCPVSLDCSMNEKEQTNHFANDVECDEASERKDEVW